MIFTKDQSIEIKRRLKWKYDTLQKACTWIGISNYTLSRILHGSSTDIYIYVKILIATDILEDKKYRFPKLDFETFKILNGLTKMKNLKEF